MGENPGLSGRAQCNLMGPYKRRVRGRCDNGSRGQNDVATSQRMQTASRSGKKQTQTQRRDFSPSLRKEHGSAADPF